MTFRKLVTVEQIKGLGDLLARKQGDLEEIED